jgi:hypothetical protein
MAWAAVTGHPWSSVDHSGASCHNYGSCGIQSVFDDVEDIKRLAESSYLSI